MATTTWPTAGIPELKDGDRLTVAEFERRYHAATHIKKAELIEGVVYVASPVSDDHGQPHARLGFWGVAYQMQTPHVFVAGDGTVRLDGRNQPQPDMHIRIESGRGGQASLSEDRYVEGAPELVAEVSVSTVGRDLKEKLEAYRRNGVREYLVWRVLDQAVDWFILREGRFERLEPGADGVYRSEVFPGLWLDAGALIGADLTALFQALQRGLASQEHAAFVAQLSNTGGPRQG